MKFKPVFITSFFLLSMLLLTNSLSAQSSVTVEVDGEPVYFQDQKPMIKEGRTLVPVRPIFESMNAEVNWNQSTKTVSTTLRQHDEAKTAMIVIGAQHMLSQYIDENGEKKTYAKQLDVPAQVINGRTMIPLRATGDVFGYDVFWDATNHKASLNASGQLLSQEEMARENKYAEEPVEKPKEEKQTSFANTEEQKVFELVNEKRAQHGLDPLSYDDEVGKVAREKSQDMLDQQYFSHESPVYGSPFEMLKTFDVHYRLAAENIGAGYQTPEQAMNGWMNSAGHRNNILNSSYTHMGVGYVEGNSGYGKYWTQLFISK